MVDVCRIWRETRDRKDSREDGDDGPGLRRDGYGGRRDDEVVLIVKDDSACRDEGHKWDI